VGLIFLILIVAILLSVLWAPVLVIRFRYHCGIRGGYILGAFMVGEVLAAALLVWITEQLGMTNPGLRTLAITALVSISGGVAFRWLYRPHGS
jgi:hypothetical protein